MLVKFEQNRMVQITQNFEFSNKKWLAIFYKALMPVIEDVVTLNVSVAEITVWC